MHIDYPLAIDGRGRTAATTDADHVRDRIEQLLLTSPGERVNRPDFGSGLLQLVFGPNSQELELSLQFTMQAALQQWLGDVIQLEDLTVTSRDATLAVEIAYTIRRTGETRVETIERNGLP